MTNCCKILLCYLAMNIPLYQLELHSRKVGQITQSYLATLPHSEESLKYFIMKRILEKFIVCLCDFCCRPTSGIYAV